MLFRFRPLPSRSYHLALACLLLASCDLFITQEELSVVAYTGPDITQEQSTEGWTAQVTGSRVLMKSPVSLFQKDEVFFITLTDREAALPTLQEVWAGRENGPGRTLKKARIEIQEWSLSGVISGVFATKRPSGFQVYERFWIDLAPVP